MEMQTRHIVLPNGPENFILQEMCERLKEGQTVTMLFGGTSMLPLIYGRGDKVRLRPLAESERCVEGEVYLFCLNGHYIIHRFIRYEGDTHVFRGDNCYNYERTTRDCVLAKLIAIEKTTGQLVDCESDDWRRQSKKVLRKRDIKHMIIGMVNQKARRRWAVVYFILLAILMWAPLNGLGLALDNYVFGLRLDHLLHASVFLLCPLFLADWLDKRYYRMLVIGLLIGIVTESVQMLLPYRGFDVNDLIANFLGVLIGWAVMLPRMRRHRRLVNNKIQ